MMDKTLFVSLVRFTRMLRGRQWPTRGSRPAARALFARPCQLDAAILCAPLEPVSFQGDGIAQPGPAPLPWKPPSPAPQQRDAAHLPPARRAIDVMPRGMGILLTLPISEFSLCSCGFLVHPPVKVL